MSETSEKAAACRTENGNADTQALVDLLTFEIDSVEKRSQQYGWTPWALKGAAAALLWLLSIEWAGSTGSWSETLVIALILSLAYDVIVFTSILFEPTDDPPELEARFYETRFLFSGSRRHVAVCLIRSIALLGVASFVSPILSCWGSILAGVHYGIVSVLAFIGLILSFLHVPFPMPAKTQRKRGMLVNLLAMGIMVTSCALLTEALFTSPAPASAANWRVAGLLVSLSLIGLYLGKSRTRPALLPVLSRLRRELIIGDVSPESVKSQIDIALKGMTVARTLQAPLREVLESYGALTRSQDALIGDLKALEPSLPRNPTSQAAEQESVLNSILNSARANSDRMRSHSEDLKVAYRRLGLRISILLKLAPHAQQNVSELFQQVEVAKQESDKRFDETLERLGKLGASIQEIVQEHAQAKEEEE